jgi:hypothetical protein
MVLTRPDTHDRWWIVLVLPGSSRGTIGNPVELRGCPAAVFENDLQIAH